MNTRRLIKSNAGFSLIEVVVASTFLLVILLGVLPVFGRSTVSNMQSSQATQATAFARTVMEEYFQAAFDDPNPALNRRMTLDTGTELLTTEYLDPVTEEWTVYTTPDPPAAANEQWIRTVTVRQFHISAIDDGVLDVAEALDATADPANVHLKQVLITVERSTALSTFGRPKTITINLMKSS